MRLYANQLLKCLLMGRWLLMCTNYRPSVSVPFRANLISLVGHRPMLQLGGSVIVLLGCAHICPQETVRGMVSQHSQKCNVSYHNLCKDEGDSNCHSLFSCSLRCRCRAYNPPNSSQNTKEHKRPY